MTKQEFMAMSLLSGLKYDIKTDLYRYPTLIGIRKDYLEFNYNGIYLSFQKDFVGNPILHPLSDLTKEIEHDGERFIPIVKLGYWIDMWLNTSHDALCLEDALELIEWHFDIAGLIEKGEAIDINSLDTNPYK